MTRRLPGIDLVGFMMVWRRRSLFQFVVDFLCPPTCASCGDAIEAGGLVCASCFGRLRCLVAPCCQRCGEPLSQYEVTEKEASCSQCVQNPPVWRYARAAFAYNDAARRLILPMKYEDKPLNASFLAFFMRQAANLLIKSGETILIPVPLYHRKLKKRRYNQAALLVSHLARYYHVQAVLDGLVRRHDTRSLALLSVSERHEELRDMFEVRDCYRSFLEGKHVVLVDDILTTGTTAEACARALLDVGCAAVDILVAARSCTGQAFLS